MNLSGKKRGFLNKKGGSLAVLSVIFVSVFLFAVYYFLNSGSLTGNVVYENIFGKSGAGITGNSISSLEDLREGFSSDLKINYPISYAAYVNVDEINYSVSGGNLDSCWYSFDFGQTNSSTVSAGVNFTGLDLADGTYDLIIYCNDSSGSAISNGLRFVVGDFNFASEVNKINASDGAEGDFFGYSVAISGDYAIAGISEYYYGSGLAYIFKKNSTTGKFEEVGNVISGAGTGGKFGSSVSISGDYAIVGASSEDSKKGAAYIFKRNSTNDKFELVNKINVSDGAKNDFFGSSVSISGDYAIVGAGGDNIKNGSAYIFKRNSTNDKFELVNKINVSDGAAGDHFGSSVSISGDYAIVGAYGNEGGKGAVYVFKRNFAQGDRFEKLHKVNSSAEVADFFGYSVSISGDYAIVGSPYGGHVEGGNPGLAYILWKNLTTGKFEELYRINASDGDIGDWFGSSVSISGDYAIVGAERDGGKNGSAYIFKRNSTNDDKFELVNKINASDGDIGDWFGSSVSISGDYAIVGAWGDEGRGKCGSAYVYKMHSRCIPSIKNTTPSEWLNLNCVSDKRNQSQNWTEYDENDCGDFTNVTHYNYRLVGPELKNTSWSNWTNISCLSNDKMNQTRERTQFDVYGCVVNTTFIEYQAVEYCNYSFYSSCVPNWSCTEWSSCVGRVKTRTCTDLNGCLNLSDKPEESQSCSTGRRDSSSSKDSDKSRLFRISYSSSLAGNVSELKTGDKVEFYLSDYSIHTLELLRVSGGRAYFAVDGNKVRFDLSAGKGVHLDLNSDKKEDVYLKVESISSNKVVLFLRSTARSTDGDGGSNGGEGNGGNDGGDDGEDTSDPKENGDDPSTNGSDEVPKRFTPRNIFLFVCLFVLVLIQFILLYYIIAILIDMHYDKKYAPYNELKYLIEKGSSSFYQGNKKEAREFYDRAREIFEANKEICKDLFRSLNELYRKVSVGKR